MLELCRALLEALQGAGYTLSEYEALLLLPAVVDRAGHNQVRAVWCGVHSMVWSMRTSP